MAATDPAPTSAVLSRGTVVVTEAGLLSPLRPPAVAVVPLKAHSGMTMRRCCGDGGFLLSRCLTL